MFLTFIRSVIKNGVDAFFSLGAKQREERTLIKWNNFLKASFPNLQTWKNRIKGILFSKVVQRAEFQGDKVEKMKRFNKFCYYYTARRKFFGKISFQQSTIILKIS